MIGRAGERWGNRKLGENNDKPKDSYGQPEDEVELLPKIRLTPSKSARPKS